MRSIFCMFSDGMPASAGERARPYHIEETIG